MTVTPKDITEFWLDEVGPEGWFVRSNKLDATIRARFLAAWEDAPALTARWQGSAEDTLGALILTDQFPRNMFRDDPRAFATDDLARKIAANAIKQGFDHATPAKARPFFYLPYEHSEDLADQDRSVELAAKFLDPNSLRHAELHRDTIKRFGRFPWRNVALGRTDTEAERRLLDGGGYGALVTRKLSLADF